MLKANARITKGNGYDMVCDNLTMQGMSGGGIFAASGGLIGMHGRRARSSTHCSREETIKTGYNQGIPIDYFTDHMSGRIHLSNGKKNHMSQAEYLASSKIDGSEQTVLRLLNEAGN